MGAFLYAGSAFAVQQPGGETVPVIQGTTCAGENTQICLDDEEATAGGAAGALDAIMAAQTTPELYDPSCELTFRVVARGANFDNTFGWYNAVPDPANAGQYLKPPDTDLHAFLLCSDDVGTTKVLDIRSNEHYTGGLIGFFMASPEGVGGNCPTFNEGGGPVAGTYGYIYYSQSQFNPDNNPDGESYIHLLTWQSLAHQDSFYFGWEDTLSGGDNDFNDLLTRVSGIQCSGGGEPCDTGLDGICKDGTMQCQGGVLECVPNQDPNDETCNAVDDDCDGEVDDGDLCPEGKICDRGRCVPRCGGGEFACSGGLVCDEEAGVCIEPECVGVNCEAEQICVDGECVGACDGVVCPSGRVCRSGACVDPCTGVTCDEGDVCKDGLCQDCGCTGCDDGLECVEKACIPTECADVTCNAGFHCAAGNCVDSCMGAICPDGQKCELGECVPGDGGPGEGGATGTGGIIDVPDGGLVGGTSSTGGSSSGTGGSGIGDPRGGESAGGCGCRVGSRPTAFGSVFLLTLLAFGLMRRRARRAV